MKIVWKGSHPLLVMLMVLLCISEDIELNILDVGPVSGVRLDGVNQYLGVPYAIPPIGKRRWRAPESIKPWTEKLNCSVSKPLCYQVDEQGYPISENCLYMDIYTPELLDPNEKLPVLIWIHGGGYKTGGNFMYPGNELVKKYRVIYVTIQYRLGIFGFLTSVMDGGKIDANVGLLDQQLALRWIHENIGNFNGDPDRITLFGGTNVVLHLLLKESFLYYSRAIIQSPTSIDFDFSHTNRNIHKLYLETECTNLPDKLECLREKSAEEIYQKNIYEWIPTIDGVVLKSIPKKLLKKGKFNKVPIIIGSNIDEGGLFLYTKTGLQESDGLKEYQYDKLMEGLQDVHYEFLDFYEDQFSVVSDDYERWKVMNNFFGDLYVSCVTEFLSNTLSKYTDVYRYIFDHHSSVHPMHFLGSTHTMEITFVFNDDQILGVSGFTDEEQELSNLISSIWTSFARDGHIDQTIIKWEMFDNNRHGINLSLQPKKHHFPELKSETCKGII
eukprot:TRINITY_DN11578_c0_g1_i1.p1 TRINITY_DN11578_c0_g1~~TRINITY_DN11578_c0_g1_i1.p1  ORF type:complete len:499 (-),score=94.50 TRINITY_DN11578_c0_g1_i1:11-1507(-)